MASTDASDAQGTIIAVDQVGAAPEDGPFLTAVRNNESGPVIVQDPPAMDRARQLHTQLSGVVTTLNDKVCTLLARKNALITLNFNLLTMLSRCHQCLKSRKRSSYEPIVPICITSRKNSRRFVICCNAYSTGAAAVTTVYMLCIPAPGKG